MKPSPISTPPARGAGFNPPNRFEKLALELDAEAPVDEDGNPLPLRTQFFRDDTQTIIAFNDSPDIPFRAGVSPYRGCEHGCAYCFARPYHEYLGFSAGLDFESKIMVKMRAAELLRAALSKKSWEPQPIAMSGVTDVYQPIERRLALTRACLAVCAEFRQPVAIITKNHLVTRDRDLLGELAKFQCASVCLSLTTLDGDLAKELEPRASTPARRLAAIAECAPRVWPFTCSPLRSFPVSMNTRSPHCSTPRRRPVPSARVTRSCGCRWPLHRSSKTGSKSIGPVTRRRFSVASANCEEDDSTTRVSAAECAAKARSQRRSKRSLKVARRKAGLASRDRVMGLPVGQLSTAAFRVPAAQLSLFEE
jgi:hypothetical protein